MFCPECRGEFQDGVVECAACGVPLVASPPEEELHPDVQLVTVFEASDPSRISLAESLLLGAEIPYLAKGSQIQDLFGWGRFPGGLNLIAGPVHFQVPEEHAEAAHELLQDLEAGEADGALLADDGADEGTEEPAPQ